MKAIDQTASRGTFWAVTPADFQRSIAWARTEPNPVAAGVREAALAQVAAPLFIPLKREYFEAYAWGEKREEYRLLGARWNQRTCYPGRPVILSCGYGKVRRLGGRVTGTYIVHFPDWLPGWVACYGKNTGPALVIGIEISS